MLLDVYLMTLGLYIVSELYILYKQYVFCLKTLFFFLFQSFQPPITHAAVSLSCLAEWQWLRLLSRMVKPLPEIRCCVQRCRCLLLRFWEWIRKKKKLFFFSSALLFDSLLCTSLLQTRFNTAAKLKKVPSAICACKQSLKMGLLSLRKL